MKKTDASEIFRKIALARGIDENEVRDEIQRAINEGIKSTDPQVQNHWRAMCKNGASPTPEDVILYVVSKIREKSSPV